MDLSGKILKLKDSKIRGSLETAQYILTYKHSKNSDEASRTSHAILSALGNDGEVLLELNSSLFYNSDKSQDELVFKCLDYAKELGFKYRYRKIVPSGSSGFLGKFLLKKKGNAHELMVLIPAENWQSESILKFILPYGARYYISNSQSEDNLLEEIGNMTDREKLGFFKVIAFDLAMLGHMGINSSVLELDDVRKLLSI